jgi:predicted nicotinamide N-methyase
VAQKSCLVGVKLVTLPKEEKRQSMTISQCDTLQEKQLQHLRGILPLIEVNLTLKNRDWRITTARDQSALLNIADEMEQFPYGYLLWESAIGLAQFMEREPHYVAGKRVLELGAGLGLSGIVAHALGAEVWQTDHLEGVLAVAHHNAQENGIEGIQQFVEDWCTWKHTGQYDVLIGADILYEKQIQSALEQVFCAALSPQGTLLLSDPQRSQSFAFIADLEKRGWRFTLETVLVRKETPEKTPPVEVVIYIGKREQ